MKKIGLIGGTGPESTLMYYKELNSRIDKLTNGAAMPEISIESVDFRRLWGYITAGDNEKLAEYFSEKAEILRRSGAEIIALTCVTGHMVIGEIEKKTGISLVSIPKALRDHAVKHGYKKVGLLGTIFTMEQDYMKNDLTEAGIEVIVPGKEERLLVAKRILDELEYCVIKESTLAEFNGIIADMRDRQGIEAVILGCTELPLLLNNENCVLPCMDSVDIHIDRLIELALAE